ncbi:MAG: hypothetical protein MJ252_16505, partial [archaeon]|nr:hypothetical protein [archaeon]
MFTQVIEYILPVEHYIELVGVMTDCAVVLPFIEKYVNKVYNHLNNLNSQMCLTNLLYKWFISLFMENMSPGLWIPIWDLMMIEGNIVLIKAAIIIILLCKDEIVKKKEVGELFIFFEETISCFNSPKFLEMLIEKKFTFDMKYLCESRSKNLPKIIESIKKTKENKKEDENESCNGEWPLCLSAISKVNIPSVLVLKEQFPIKMTSNLFDSNINVYSFIKYFNKKRKVKEDNEFCLLRSASNDSESLDAFGESISEKKKHKLYHKNILYRAIHICGSEAMEEEESSDDRSYST